MLCLHNVQLPAGSALPKREYLRERLAKIKRRNPMAQHAPTCNTTFILEQPGRVSICLSERIWNLHPWLSKAQRLRQAERLCGFVLGLWPVK